MDVERLINQHKDAVYKQLVRTCGNYEDAEDALADALLAALRASEQLRDPALFQAWLARIGTRACARMRIRERLSRQTSLAALELKGFEIIDTQSGPDREAELSSLKSCVAGAIELLPEIYRHVYLRREVFGEKAEDVAVQTGLSVAAVKSRLHRARNLVRDALDNGLGCRGILEPDS